MKKIITLIFLAAAYVLNAQEISENETNLIQYFKNINEKNIECLIPYKNSKEKFGWYDIRDMKVVTPAIFDYVDFEYNKVLSFKYNSIYYEFSLPQKIEKVKFVHGFQEEPIVDESISGFRFDGKNADRYSSKFKEVRIINEKTNSKIGIAENLSNMKGIINEDGTVLPGFDFNFTEINYFQNDKNEIYFITKKPKEIDYIIYSRNGKVIPFPPIVNYNIVSSSGELSFHYYSPYQNEKLCVVTFENQMNNVFDENTFKFILSKNYSDIQQVNVINLRLKNKKIKKYMCRVKEGGEVYYVDELGAKYNYIIE